MPKIEINAIEQSTFTTYPESLAAHVAGRLTRGLARFSDFGVAQIVLKPGAQTNERAWSETDDEFYVVTEGEITVVRDDDEEVLHAGDCYAFPKGGPNAHKAVNRSDRDCSFLVVMSPLNGTRHYPDIDLFWDGAKKRYLHKDGTPYPGTAPDFPAPAFDFRDK